MFRRMEIKRGFGISLLLITVVMILGGSNVKRSLAELNQEYQVFLPSVVKNYPPPPTVFGSQFLSFNNQTIIQMADDAKISWARVMAFDWSKIEPNQPKDGVHKYDWSSVPEDSLKNLSDQKMYTIAIIYKTPPWAQKHDGIYCGPIKDDKLDEFATFLRALVDKYSKPPFSIHYWELGNEPDVDRNLVPPDSNFGCWGDENDSYYGGEYYAEMLKVAYPAIKSVDTSAKVLNGGLLLDCDPSNSDVECNHETSPHFLEGILKNGGGSYFDTVSYHGYPYYVGGKEFQDMWDERGGADIGKAKFLQEVMAKYGVSKPIMNTEASLLCPDWNKNECNPPGDDFYEVQADYVIRLYTRTWENGLLGAIWYPFYGGGWRYSDLIGDNISNPNPAYQVYKFMANTLSGMQYKGKVKVNEDDSLEGYKFSNSGKTIWIVWSPDFPHTHTMNPPSETIKVMDKYGDNLTFDSGLQVNSPIYVELP